MRLSGTGVSRENRAERGKVTPIERVNGRENQVCTEYVISVRYGVKLFQIIMSL